MYQARKETQTYAMGVKFEVTGNIGPEKRRLSRHFVTVKWKGDGRFSHGVQSRARAKGWNLQEERCQIRAIEKLEGLSCIEAVVLGSV